MFRRRGSLVLVLLFSFALAAQEAAPGVQHTGEYLVSVRDAGAIQTSALEAQGWTSRTLLTTPGKVWVLLSPPGTTKCPRVEASPEHPWDRAHRSVATSALGTVMNAIDMAQVIEIEPVVAYEMRGFGERYAKAMAKRKANPPACAEGSGSSVVSCLPASFQWPNGKQMSWHLTNTQLGMAQSRAAAAFARPPVVRIAHLDTGYYPAADAITPPNFQTGMSRSFIPCDVCGETGIDCYKGGLPNGHGPETLSVLAGGNVSFAGGNGYPAYNGYVGGAPLAEVFTYRVSPSVILLFPMHVAQGIVGAVENQADVISMSMGGAPSYFLRDAVNYAYDNGIAMFFAAADFLRLPVPIVPVEIPPHTMVYPARFTTATPVSGMTASGRSYGLNPSCFLNVLRGEAFNWMMRGSYGPAHLMRDRALTANSPNITARYGTSQFPKNQVHFSFEGTSAATPQAAAAAALWLQVHRGEFTPEEWRSWVKTQSVYDALTSTAFLPKRAGAVEEFGAGLIQANEALDVRRPANPVKRAPGTIGVDWITIVAAILGVDPNDPPPTGQEAEVRRRMLQLEVAQLLTTEPELRDIVNGDFENTPSQAQLQQLARALERHPRASRYLRRAVSEGPVRKRR